MILVRFPYCSLNTALKGGDNAGKLLCRDGDGGVRAPLEA
jgi:hypothetical protein